MFKVRGQHELEIATAAVTYHYFVLGHRFALRFLNGGFQSSAVLGEVDNNCIASCMKGGVSLRVHRHNLAFSPW
jgi:hypothetical protein